jgi:hypothetical protein
MPVMRIKLILTGISLSITLSIFSQSIGVGTNSPDASAQLDVVSTSKGVLLPRMTLAQRNLISTPATGLMVYQTDNTPGYYFYNGSVWIQLSTGASTNYWSLNGSNHIYNNNAGTRVGINTSTPAHFLDVYGDARVYGAPLKLQDFNSNNATVQFLNSNGTPTHHITHLNTLGGLLMIQKLPATTLDWVMDINGRVGMGTTVPVVKLHIDNGGLSGEVFRIEGQNPQMGLATDGILKGFFNLTGDDVKIGTLASNDLGKFIVRLNGGDRMFVHPDGRVSIGTITPATGYMLSVNGKIISEEVRVELDVNWPDYVFKQDYKLPSLKQVENFIQKNNHLPGIPSAAQVKKEGIELGDMNKRLLEKIEELTLYLIQQNKEIETLRTKVSSLEKNSTH